MKRRRCSPTNPRRHSPLPGDRGPKILILGGGGQLGRALIERVGTAGQGFDKIACDICDAPSVARAMSAPSLDIVVNCAAYTAVDRAEIERERAFSINADGARIVARTAAARGLPVIHLSTDYVYAGTGSAPHREDDPIAPLNAYGTSKAAGDAAVAHDNPAHLLLRVSWVFGVYGKNFVKTMLRLGRERHELGIVEDQIGGPTESRDIADAILTMAATCRRPGFSAWGIYHFAGAPSTSWYGFAQAIFERARLPAPRLVALGTREYPTTAARPLNSTLDCSRIYNVFGVEQPDWHASLSRVMAALEGETE
jgi:dTDP-4-dehydrorhamnose reductase